METGVDLQAPQATHLCSKYMLECTVPLKSLDKASRSMFLLLFYIVDDVDIKTMKCGIICFL